MSEIMEVAYQRQISDVTRDIRIQTGQFLRTAIEIGRLLFEAKAMVEPGGWSKYIEEELPFSHSWANNYMKLYKEFGGDQTSLFGDSQAFMNLRPTQAMELLALPAAEREEFVQTHDVADMSTRQLRQAVQEELEEARRKNAATMAELEAAKAQARDAEQNLLDMQNQLAAAKSTEGAWQQELDRLNADKSRAEESEANALDLLKKAQKQVEEAKAREDSIRAELKKAKENPDIPESMMEQLRREAEASAAEKATTKAQKELDAAMAQVQEATREKEAAEAAARDAREKLVAAQKSEKLSNQDVMSINVLGQQLLSIWNMVQGHRKKAIAADQGNAAPIDAFLGKVLDTMRDSMKEGI